MNYCKLTNQNLQTHNGCQWVIGEWKKTNGEGELCTDGWLHAYTHPLLAVFLNPIHARIKSPRLFEIEVGGDMKGDSGLKISFTKQNLQTYCEFQRVLNEWKETSRMLGMKVGFTKMRLIKEIPLPQVTDTQRIAFGILCAKEVEISKNWLKWADNWLNNTDRTAQSAYNAKITMCTNVASTFAACAARDVHVIPANVVVDSNAAYAVEDAARSKLLNLIELAQKALSFN